MRIHYLKLKNYRPYRNTTIEFSRGSRRNFTIIQGANGAGKTNILNAITWCLYGEERHLSEENQGLPLINEKVYAALEPGKPATVEVELGLGDDELQYRITRKAKAYRRLDGEATVRVDSDPEVMYQVAGNWRTSDQPNYTIEVLLPAGVSRFFFFDAEQLDEFFKKDSSDRVESGIVRVSQIDLLEQSIRHLETVRTSIRRTAKGLTPQADKIREELDELEKKLKECRGTLAQLGIDRNELQNNLDATSKQLRESEVKEVRELQEQRDGVKRTLKDKKTFLENLEKDARGELRKIGPRVYAYAALQKAFDLINEQVKRGDLPPKVRESFFEDLLDANECVCGRGLMEGTEERVRVVKRMESVMGEEYEGALEGKYKLGPILQELPQLASQQSELSRVIWGIEQEIEEAGKRLREISQKIEKIGEVNLEEVKTLEQQNRTYQEEFSKVNQQIGFQKAVRARLERDLDRKNRELENALKKDKQQRDLRIRLELCDQALDMLKQIRSELLAEVREQIERKTEEYFLELIWKKGTYRRVKIDSGYQINVLNIREMPSLGTLSAGERQVLALAFMAALGTISGFDAPIVIDTPIGRISGDPRDNIAESLPNYLADTQVTLLVTDTEYTEAVRLRLNARIGKEYRLNFAESESETKVVPL